MPAKVTRPLTLKLDELDAMLCADPDVVAGNYLDKRKSPSTSFLVKADYATFQLLVLKALEEGHTHVTMNFETR